MEANQAVQLSQEHANLLLNSSQWSISFGPLTLSLSVDLSVPQVTVSATLLGVSIGSVTLSPSNPTATIGGSIGPFTAEVTLTINVANKTLDYHVQVKGFGVGIDKSGTINL